MFYNVNKERGATLAKSREKVKHQDKRILHLFKVPKSDFTAWEVFECFDQVWPITSVRRSIHTLWTDGKLIDTGLLRKGGYGKLNRVYKLNPKAK